LEGELGAKRCDASGLDFIKIAGTTMIQQWIWGYSIGLIFQEKTRLQTMVFSPDHRD